MKMDRHINPYQMQAWIHTLQKRMNSFLENESKEVTSQERIEFIRHQYSLIDAGISIIDGTSFLYGCLSEEDK